MGALHEGPSGLPGGHDPDVTAAKVPGGNSHVATQVVPSEEEHVRMVAKSECGGLDSLASEATIPSDGLHGDNDRAAALVLPSEEGHVGMAAGSDHGGLDSLASGATIPNDAINEGGLMRHIGEVRPVESELSGKGIVLSEPRQTNLRHWLV